MNFTGYFAIVFLLLSFCYSFILLSFTLSSSNSQLSNVVVGDSELRSVYLMQERIIFVRDVKVFNYFIHTDHVPSQFFETRFIFPSCIYCLNEHEPYFKPGLKSKVNDRVKRVLCIRSADRYGKNFGHMLYDTIYLAFYNLNLFGWMMKDGKVLQPYSVMWLQNQDERGYKNFDLVGPRLLQFDGVIDPEKTVHVDELVVGTATRPIMDDNGSGHEFMLQVFRKNVLKSFKIQERRSRQCERILVYDKSSSEYFRSRSFIGKIVNVHEVADYFTGFGLKVKVRDPAAQSFREQLLDLQWCDILLSPSGAISCTAPFICLGGTVIVMNIQGNNMEKNLWNRHVHMNLMVYDVPIQDIQVSDKGIGKPDVRLSHRFFEWFKGRRCLMGMNDGDNKLRLFVNWDKKSDSYWKYAEFVWLHLFPVYFRLRICHFLNIRSSIILEGPPQIQALLASWQKKFSLSSTLTISCILSFHPLQRFHDGSIENLNGSGLAYLLRDFEKDSRKYIRIPWTKLMLKYRIRI